MIQYIQYLHKEDKNMALIKCPECGRQISNMAQSCPKCGIPLQFQYQNNYMNNVPKQFNGVYRYTLFGKKKEVYCPRCNSANCSHYQVQKVIPGKTKTRYTANLNPLHPFTLVNKKEKVVRKEQTYTQNKFICNDCGKIFF